MRQKEETKQLHEKLLKEIEEKKQLQEQLRQNRNELDDEVRRLQMSSGAMKAPKSGRIQLRLI